MYCLPGFFRVGELSLNSMHTYESTHVLLSKYERS